MPFDWLLFIGDLGLRGWDFVQQRGSPFGRDEFIQAYSKSLSDAIDLVRFENPSLSDLEAGTKLTLGVIVAVVRSYHRDSDITVNANYMIPLEANQKLVEQAKFCDGTRRPDAFTCFLTLKRWANKVEGLPTHLVIPVERADGHHADRLLFGAPFAYMNNRRYVVNDTLRMRKHLDKKAHAETKAEVEKFFHDQRKRYRSFVSWPISPPPGASTKHLPACASSVIGVLNVQSSEPAVAGRSRVNHLRMEAALLPLMKVLSYFVLRLDYTAVPLPPPVAGATPVAGEPAGA